VLAWQSSGSGLPIVFLHAFPLSGQMWDVNKAEFAKHFRVVTVDFPGFGRTPAAGDIVTMDFLAEQVKQTLAATNIPDKKVFVGLSMGGYVLMRLLKLIPDQIRAAVFVSTRAAADMAETRANRFKKIEFVEKAGIAAFVEKQLPALLGPTTMAGAEDVVDNARAIALTASAVGIGAALRGMAGRPDSTDLLKQGAFPSLFVSGQEDGIIPASEMEAMSAMRPKSEFHVIERAGHLLNLERPHEFHETVATFLKRKVL
jgi:pimeloyl-ACP methyl ester carboxylesterase